MQADAVPVAGVDIAHDTQPSTSGQASASMPMHITEAEASSCMAGSEESAVLCEEVGYPYIAVDACV